MNLNGISVFLAQTPPAGSGQPAWLSLFPFVLIIVAMYFVMIRPQQKRAKELNLLLKSLRPGDKVVTASGIIGIVVSVKDKTVALRSAETKLEVLKSTISEITERTGSEVSET